MNILQMASAKLGLPSERVFVDSYFYWEVRISKKEMCNKFMDYAYDDIIPKHVTDYCIDILAGRITRTKQLKDKNHAT